MTAKITMAQRAYKQMLASVYAAVGEDGGLIETGGVLIGLRKGDSWYVAEAPDAGPQADRSHGHVHLDTAYQAYALAAARRLYHQDVWLLGLWHQQPGDMDFFSPTDDVANHAYAEQLGDAGAISLIVNTEPGLKVTCYRVAVAERTAWGRRAPVEYTRLPHDALQVGDIGRGTLRYAHVHEIVPPIAPSAMQALLGELRCIADTLGVTIGIRRQRSAVAVEVEAAGAKHRFTVADKVYADGGVSFALQEGSFAEYLAGIRGRS